MWVYATYLGFTLQVEQKIPHKIEIPILKCVHELARGYLHLTSSSVVTLTKLMQFLAFKRDQL